MFDFSKIGFSLRDALFLSEFGINLEKFGLLQSHMSLSVVDAILCLGGGLFLAIWGPNTQEIVGYCENEIGSSKPTLHPKVQWYPNTLWLSILVVLFFLCLAYLNRKSPFLYFQF
jgi:hypothetical protein